MKIIGQNYTVSRSITANDSQSIAFSNANKQVIVFQVGGEQPRELLKAVMIHEILEVLNCMYELNIPHPVLCALDTGLHQVFTDAGVDLSPLLKELDE